VVVTVAAAGVVLLLGVTEAGEARVNWVVAAVVAAVVTVAVREAVRLEVLRVVGEGGAS
jgi:hypothetical protein